MPSLETIHGLPMQKVFASPSRRRMDSKGESEEITYPSLYFAIDDFEQVWVLTT